MAAYRPTNDYECTKYHSGDFYAGEVKLPFDSEDDPANPSNHSYNTFKCLDADADVANNGIYRHTNQPTRYVDTETLLGPHYMLIKID